MLILERPHITLNHSFIDSLAAPPFCEQHPVYCVTRHHIFFAAIGVPLPLCKVSEGQDGVTCF